MPRRALAAFAVVIAAVPAGFLLARDSALLRVQDVRISGLTGDDAPAVRRALTTAARGMTTLQLDEGALRDAVAKFPTVREVRVERDLPRAVRIEVVQRGAVASVGGIAVAADGRVLRGVPARGLPTVQGATPPAGRTVADPRVAGLVAVLGAAPDALRARTTLARLSDRGPAMELRDGPVLLFGDTRRARAKWLAATAVLAHPRAAGAGYLDLRLPERPAAGAPEPSTAG